MIEFFGHGSSPLNHIFIIISEWEAIVGRMLSTKLARGGLISSRLTNPCLPAVQAMATMKPLSPEAQVLSEWVTLTWTFPT